MKIFELSEESLEKIKNMYMSCWRNAQLAEGPYYKGEVGPFMHPGSYELPVSTWAGGYYAVLMALKNISGVSNLIIQANTMRAQKTVAKLLGLSIQVAGCDWEYQLSMDPDTIADGCDLPTAVVITPLGGYWTVHNEKALQESYNKGYYTIIDAAHAHFTLPEDILEKADAVIYSFYATKSLPLGEGGLVCTKNKAIYDYLRRFMSYDKVDFILPTAANFRMDEPRAAVMYLLCHDNQIISELIHKRISIAQELETLAKRYNFECIGPNHPDVIKSNGYKFILKGNYDFGKYTTSRVFDRVVYGVETSILKSLNHTCITTYNTLTAEDLENIEKWFQHYASIRV